MAPASRDWPAAAVCEQNRAITAVAKFSEHVILM